MPTYIEPPACALCGKPATGLASEWVGSVERRYCHGDLEPSPTCYERRSILALESLSPDALWLG